MAFLNFIKRRPRNAKVALALAAALSAADMAAAPAAQAESHGFDQREEVTIYTAGHWKQLGSETDASKLSFLAVMKVEDETGARFCKVKKNGVWWTNLIDCRMSVRGLVNRMQIAEEGIMMSQGFDGFGDFAYQISASEHDRGFERQLRAAQRFILAGQHRIIVAAPVDDTARVVRTVPRPIRKPAVIERATYLEGRVAGNTVKLRMVYE